MILLLIYWFAPAHFSVRPDQATTVPAQPIPTSTAAAPNVGRVSLKEAWRQVLPGITT
jgi:hypothetical protein